MDKLLTVERATVEPLWTVEDVAAFLRIPVQTLYQWRRKGFGPQGTRVGKYIRFDPDVVREWFKLLGER